ncbi:acyl-CoA dehydrogenase family protein [Sulfitobacter sp. F26169L]|uniref:acyl-CoA dehydrogenase family protein n=1 Tax=Sulfitobacter sp. F26169L TaxID=2996015 RepID=UPI002260FCF0|nr:acyl-CoA dehydrogenase family protein [Sulfitobacter sp. F26169L]MCX7567930.1 acyl-CoA dehydrogenase family protein [Sulfitobacter sp. F26169L]
MIKRRIFEEEHDMFRESVRKWIAAEVTPNAESWREAKQVSKEAWLSAGKNGYLAMYADEEYGGMGLDDFRFDMILNEEIGKAESSFFVPLHNRIVGPYLHRYGTDDQKKRYMPGVVSGETILAIGMTEPSSGSDLAGIKTRAEKQGDHWILNGSKTYISNGQIAGLYLIAAKTDPENPRAIGLFWVEEGMEGFAKGQNLKKMGLQAQDTSELFFDNVKVPAANLVGTGSDGFKIMMTNLAEERLIGADGYLARAERAFDITMEFIKERRAFGKPIGTFQNSRFAMADVRTKLDVGWAYLDHCAMAHMEGECTAEMAAQAKLFTSEIEGEIIDTCLQLHGGAGYMEEYEISRLYVDARISRIYAGTSEIMREIIGRGLGLDDRNRN